MGLFEPTKSTHLSRLYNDKLFKMFLNALHRLHEPEEVSHSWALAGGAKAEVEDERDGTPAHCHAACIHHLRRDKCQGGA